MLVAGDRKPLIAYESELGREVELAVPTPDHYLPLLYIAATRAASDPVTSPVEGIDGQIRGNLAGSSGPPGARTWTGTDERTTASAPIAAQDGAGTKLLSIRQPVGTSEARAQSLRLGMFIEKPKLASRFHC